VIFLKNILIVIGTRPEAIKMCPLVLELKRRGNFNVRVLATGQHGEMLYSALGYFGVTPDYNLDAMASSGNLANMTESIMRGTGEVLEREKFAAVLVHGDTTTAFAAALTAFYARVPVCHVEAGLRTHNIHEPYPEEFNRAAIDSLSEYFFAPTQSAVRNLLAEGKPEKRVFLTGNTVIDAFAYTVREDFSHPALDFSKGKKLMLITAHRRENLGAPMEEMLRGISRALAAFPEYRAVFPMHKNPAVRAAAEKAFAENPQVMLTENLGVFDFHNLLSRASIVLTDSGGLQEEAPHFSVPVLVMRNVTERREAADTGAVRLVGNTEKSVFSGICEVLGNREVYEKMARAEKPFGDGRASERIADIMEERI
jgi:UDP-N-acetylglucosamine 2-epimerase (non-hydrolysing)